MKRLSNVLENKDIVNKNVISLNGLDESIVEKLKNLEGQKITECCGCGCDLGEPCCKDIPAETPCNCPNVASYNELGPFNSEYEIIRELDTCPNIDTLHNLHTQFNNFTFVPNPDRMYTTPLYFGNIEYQAIEPVKRELADMPILQANPEDAAKLYDVETRFNKKIYKVVNDLVDKYEFKYPVVQTKINGEVQVYLVKYTGTNGKEGSIKSSLTEIANILTELDDRSDIQWSQVLNVAIDNLDDRYTYLITFVFNQDKVREQIKIEKLEK